MPYLDIEQESAERRDRITDGLWWVAAVQLIADAILLVLWLMYLGV